MGIRESDLPTITISELDDLIRTVTAEDQKSQNVKVEDLAKTVIEDYKFDVAGAHQSVASAIDIDGETTSLYEEIGWQPPEE